MSEGVANPNQPATQIVSTSLMGQITTTQTRLPDGRIAMAFIVTVPGAQVSVALPCAELVAWVKRLEHEIAAGAAGIYLVQPNGDGRR